MFVIEHRNYIFCVGCISKVLKTFSLLILCKYENGQFCTKDFLTNGKYLNIVKKIKFTTQNKTTDQG